MQGVLVREFPVQLVSPTGIVTQQGTQFVGTYMYADQEAMQVVAEISPTTCASNCFFTVKRGVDGRPPNKRPKKRPKKSLDSRRGSMYK